MKYLALIIPDKAEQKVRLERIDLTGDDLAEIVHWGFYPQRTELSFTSMRAWGIEIAYDDLGLHRPEAAERINYRAMRLWAELTGRSVQSFAAPLIGTFVVLGVTDWGEESADVPRNVVELLRPQDRPRYPEA